MSKWFRWYEGTSEDGKFRVAARNANVTVATVIGLWAILLEDAAHPDHRGLALRGEEFYGAVLDIDLDLAEKIIVNMQHAGLLTKLENGIQISKWKERQFETDGTDPTNADRQRRFREKQKTNKCENAVTPLHNDAVTVSKRPDTDTDTDKNISTVAKKAPPRDERFEEFRKSYPKRLGPDPRSPAEKLFLAAIKAGEDPQAIIAGARRCAQVDAKNVGTPYIPQMQKWLRDKRWIDYTAEAEVIKFDIRKHLS